MDANTFWLNEYEKQQVEDETEIKEYEQDDDFTEGLEY